MRPYSEGLPSRRAALGVRSVPTRASARLLDSDCLGSPDLADKVKTQARVRYPDAMDDGGEVGERQGRCPGRMTARSGSGQGWFRFDQTLPPGNVFGGRDGTKHLPASQSASTNQLLPLFEVVHSSDHEKNGSRHWKQTGNVCNVLQASD